MRQSSGRTEQIRTSSAVTLYAGLLESAQTRDERCGYWTPKAARAAVEDLDQPLFAAVFRRLQAQSLGHWVTVIACKAPEIIVPRPYALYWLMNAPKVAERRAAAGDPARARKVHDRAVLLEAVLYTLVVLAILLACVWTAVRAGRQPALVALFPALWLASFWAVHAIFGIQGRYFLGMLVLAPLLCALAQRHRGKHLPG